MLNIVNLGKVANKIGACHGKYCLLWQICCQSSCKIDNVKSESVPIQNMLNIDILLVVAKVFWLLWGNTGCYGN